MNNFIDILKEKIALNDIFITFNIEFITFML